MTFWSGGLFVGRLQQGMWDCVGDKNRPIWIPIQTNELMTGKFIEHHLRSNARWLAQKDPEFQSFHKVLYLWCELWVNLTAGTESLHRYPGKMGTNYKKLTNYELCIIPEQNKNAETNIWNTSGGIFIYFAWVKGENAVGKQENKNN